ncbi:MAG TPA: MBL fold metallo-hydrolase [Gemmatimonadaceae bacterium]
MSIRPIFAVSSALLLATSGPIGRPASATSPTAVVMLGTGTPNADPERSGPSVAVVVNGQPYIVDAGPGVVRRAAAAKLPMPSLSIVFLTHLHSDHTLGLPDLMLSPWVLDRTTPLRVFGPRGTRDMVQHISAAYAKDVDIRLHGGEPSNKTGYRAIVAEIDSGIVYRDSNVTVTAFRVPHGTWDEALGYKFVARDRVIVISGDTKPTDEIVKQCSRCDVLLHEVYLDSTSKRRTPAWRAYDKAFHTSTLELGGLATRARPKLLVMYHQLYRGGTDEDLLREVHTRYSGPVVSARDLARY